MIQTCVPHSRQCFHCYRYSTQIAYPGGAASHVCGHQYLIASMTQTVLPPQRPFETEEYILDKEKLDTLLNMQEELDKVRAIAAS